MITLKEAMLRAEGVFDMAYATAIANYKKIMRQRGASERQIEEAVAEYKLQLEADKEVKMAELRVVLTADDDAPSSQGCTDPPAETR